ncbi:MAG: hypothetical protein Q8867_04670 [Bacteroidota bacterium]|nr:hypothetical protein [Bacteroidota bacterium]
MLKKILIVLMVLLTSCTFFKKKTERVLARVHDQYLYESDLKGIIPPGTTHKDSISLAKNFIDNWVRQQVVIYQASNNLTKDQMDFSRQLENYKNSLIIYEYENELVKQKLDTLVTDEEIEDYYNSNPQNFQLKDDIVQLQYVKLPKGSKAVGEFRKFLMSDDPAAKTRLAAECEKKAADYFLDDQNWLTFSELLLQIPIKTYNQEEFLKNRREVEVQDSAYLYLVRIKDFKIKESISPLSLEKGRVRDIILNKRKIELINKMHDDVLQKAIRENKVKVY